jgi:hypothetical protein
MASQYNKRLFTNYGSLDDSFFNVHFHLIVFLENEFLGDFFKN